MLDQSPYSGLQGSWTDQLLSRCGHFCVTWSLSCASRLGITVSFLRNLCNGLCTVPRFHVEEKHRCVEFLVQMSPTLSLITTNVLYWTNVCLYLESYSRRFRGEAIFSVTWSFELFLRSVQYGIVIMCFIDACAYVLKEYRRNIENLGNFVNWMKVRVRGYHTSCIPSNMSHKTDTCSRGSGLPLAEAQSQISSSSQSSYHITRKRQCVSGMVHLYRLRYSRRECLNPQLGGCHRSISIWRIDIMFGPVISTEAHLAFSGAKTHTPIRPMRCQFWIEASLSFLGPPWSGCPRCALVYFLWLQECCWCLFGYRECDCPLGSFPRVTSSFACSMSRPSASLTSLGRSRVVRQCFRSLEWNVWPLGQSDSAHRLRAQLPQLHEWGARRSISQTVTEGSRARTTLPWSTTEDPEGFPNSGAYSSSSSKQGSTMLGSFDVSSWKQWRDHESVDNCAGNQEIGSNLDRILCSNWFQFTAKKEERSRS